ncbi:putative peptidoglycan lipid II flippase [Motilibacter rhizosphaerae]|uniref:Putative peptidoglycan lipid II flippase n=1 Tax=Motilibacter rhizosphaerae TaxID=598652 RepID=A0A4Q7NBF0_9ACTN|nr:lipid II flippase MurJ [Motilibacter rhizosphaerae]RZS80229.1 putative peptidoglycan lipid II flippase [Motilibacter rhizosphaerae]
MSTAVGRRAGSLVGAAGLIAALTLLSRVVGSGRSLVFAVAVGDTPLGTAYATANQLPNVLFEVAAGGALAGVVVPLLAGPLERGDREEAGAVASALLAWTLVVLVPIALVAALVGPPLLRALFGGEHEQGDAAATMLLAFVPQVPLYGVAVVTAGILQAQRRFLAAAAAPLASSLVVVASYAVFGAVADARSWPGRSLPAGALAVLAGGTTLGVVALALVTAAPALRSTTVPLRPRMRLDPATAARARALALSGVAAVLAQQVLAVVVIVVADLRDPHRALVVHGWAWTLFTLPYAVLAVPLATSAYPALSRHATRGDTVAYAALAARSTRAVVLASGLGVALLAGAAHPLGALFVPTEPWRLAGALLAFAPGLLGFGLLAHLGRALYALHAGRAAGTAAVTGWGTAAALAALLGSLVPRGEVVPAIGAATSAGLLLAGGMLLRALHRAAGPAALAGVGRGTGLSVLAALAGTAAGLLVGSLLPPGAGRAAGAGLAVGAAVAAATAYGAVALLVDRRGARETLEGIRHG